MAKQVRRLGRGLDSLVSPVTVSHRTTQQPAQPDGGDQDQPARASTATIPTHRIRPNPFQPRKTFDSEAIRSLSESIRRCGVLQPISVRKIGPNYQLIAGERRWQAAKTVGLEQIPAVVRDATDEQMLEFALVENIQREDLNAIDRAKAYKRYCDSFGVSASDVADRLGEDRSTVTNYLRLLELDQTLQDLVAGRRLSMGHARSLLGIQDTAMRASLADRVIQDHVSVRALEDLVRRERERGLREPSKPRTASPSQEAYLRELAHRFELSVKTKVTILEGKRKGSGRIIMEYFSLEDFDRIAALLGVELE